MDMLYIIKNKKKKNKKPAKPAITGFQRDYYPFGGEVYEGRQSLP